MSCPTVHHGKSSFKLIPVLNDEKQQDKSGGNCHIQVIPNAEINIKCNNCNTAGYSQVSFP